jgi:hypothetical protein
MLGGFSLHEKKERFGGAQMLRRRSTMVNERL